MTLGASPNKQCGYIVTINNNKNEFSVSKYYCDRDLVDFTSPFCLCFFLDLNDDFSRSDPDPSLSSPIQSTPLHGSCVLPTRGDLSSLIAPKLLFLLIVLLPDLPLEILSEFNAVSPPSVCVCVPLSVVLIASGKVDLRMSEVGVVW